VQIFQIHFFRFYKWCVDLIRRTYYAIVNQNRVCGIYGRKKKRKASNLHWYESLVHSLAGSTKPIVCARNENRARSRFPMYIPSRAGMTRDNKCSIPLPTEAHWKRNNSRSRIYRALLRLAVVAAAVRNEIRNTRRCTLPPTFPVAVSRQSV